MTISITKFKAAAICFILLMNVSFLYAQHNLEWVKTTAGNVYNPILTLDSAGDIYMSGFFTTTVDFDPGPGTYSLTPASGASNFVAKYDAAGNFIWVKAIVSGGSISPYNTMPITLDKNGNCYIVSIFAGTADFDPGPGVLNLTSAAMGNDIFLTKLNTTGDLVWVKQMTGADYCVMGGIALDTLGQPHISGVFTGTMDFNPATGAADTANLFTASIDLFVAKYDTSGNLIWARQTVQNGGFVWIPGGISVDKNGDVCTGGSFVIGPVDFNPSPAPADTFYLTPVGFQAGFISKLDASGNFSWAKLITGNDTSNVWTTALANDKDGNIVYTGKFTGTSDFNPGIAAADTFKMTAIGPYITGYVSKLRADGTFMWAGQFSGGMPGVDDGAPGLAIALDKDGNSFVTGKFSGTVDFDPGTAVASYSSTGLGTDMYISKLDPAGNFVWAAQMEGDADIAGLSIAVDNVPNVYTTGIFGTSADFDPNAPVFTVYSSSPTGQDAFIQKLSCNSWLTLDVTACNHYSLNDQSYDSTGLYIQTMNNMEGCDSIIKLNLTIDTLDISVDQNNGTLTSGNDTASFYQWINCTDGSAIPGATSQSFTATVDGDYAVAVGYNGCSDTSACFSVVNTGISNYEKGNAINVLPNPSSGTINISTDHVFHNASVSLTDMAGRTIMKKTAVSGSNCYLDISAAASGIYFVEVRENCKTQRIRIVKE